ncbi:MAG: alpha/beta hydrolase [Bacteroidota bacterium]
MRLRPRLQSDLNGAVRLATDAVLGVTDVVEAAHQAVWTTLGIPAQVPGRTRYLTGRIYAAVRGITCLVGHGVARAVRPATVPRGLGNPRQGTPTLRAVLNGVVGDYLAATANPLATPMSLQVGGRPLVCESTMDAEGAPQAFDVPEATSRIVLFVHGLCMDERAWGADTTAQREPDASSYPEVLVAQGYTPLRVRYNTGLPIADNGRRLAGLLGVLHARWPAPVDEIAVVAHSMGGLVVRSALHHADTLKGGTTMAWRRHLRRIVCLGTPHHGAPLERFGGWVDAMLGRSRFTAPYAMIGAMRSAGITDLRQGRVSDRAEPVALPPDVAWYAIAGALGDGGDQEVLRPRSWSLVGDGLVPVASALGDHRDADLRLSLREHHRHIVSDTGHLALLRSPEVAASLVRWLRPRGDSVNSQHADDATMASSAKTHGLAEDVWR